MTFGARRQAGRGLLAGAAGALSLALSAPASGATWAAPRTTPSLRQIVAVDATGEPNWPYGSEDVAGDGVATFNQPEQTLDVRTGYAATDPTRLWLRAYVSAEAGPSPDVVVYIFVDSDANPATGGSADAPEIDAKLTNDPTPGGYEYVVGVRGNGSVVGVWAFQLANPPFARVPQARTQGEAGRDLDPIRFGADVRGYVQVNVELDDVGIAPTCGSQFFFRSVNTAQAGPNGDLDVGGRAACVAPDADGDQVPDPTEPPPCTRDDQCPNRGVCVDNRCVLAVPCGDAADCPSGRECVEGRCVVPGGGACTDNAQCGGRVCRAGTCAACTPGGAECGANARCGPDGTCVGGGGNGGGAGGSGPSLSPDGRVEGGAFNCSGSGGSPAGGGAAIATLFAAAIAGCRRAARRRRGR
ncbi:MAG TPA: EB domain-containing protein [Polyangiaceae bacterium]|nr:EB domain-containing protein [Polyangiaceae bacterium]